MKANEAPKKIYMPNELLSEEWQRHIEGEDTEYTRTDAFIDKACDWLKTHSRNDFTTYNSFGQPTFHKSRMIKAFISAMEEEV